MMMICKNSMIRSLYSTLFLILLFIQNQEISPVQARRSLLSYPENHDTALVATLDGTIYLVYRDSGRVIWSFASGSAIYSSHQAPIIHDHDYADATNYFIDLGDDWKLFAHTDAGKHPMDMDMKEFIRIMPHVSEDGGVILASKKTSAFAVDASNGKIIRVHHSSPDTTSDSIVPKTITKHGNPDRQLSFTRTDYILTSFAPNSNQVLWNVTVADIDVALFCYQNQNLIAGPSSSPVVDVGSTSHDSFNMPLSCQSKVDVHRLRIPRLSAKQTEDKAPVLSLPPTELLVLLPNPEKLLLVSRDHDFETMGQSSKISGPQDVRKHVVSERRIAFFVISALIIIIGFLMYRHYTLMSVMLNKNAKSSSSRRRRNRKTGNNFGNEDGYGVMEVDSEKSLLKFNHLIECDTEGRSIGKLFVSSKEIAKGSNGTIVLEGVYEGRKVAVKRLVRAHHDVAFKEIQNLIASDQHPNIVRWYGVEYDQDFVYLSLERCACSLYDLIQMYSDSCQNMGPTHSQMMNDVMREICLWKPNGYPSHILLKLMRDMVSGLLHLHELGIIHRDLKPHNVLIVKEKVLCGKLSDMGISRRLVGDMSSLGHHATGSGSSGWQAPEQLLLGRQTRAVDLFSLGCVLFFCMTRGRHPFGDHLERDVNVAKNKVSLFLVEHIPEAVNLFSQLLNPNAELRPKASEVLHHPFFWNCETRVSFLRDTSDRVELEDREAGSIVLGALESKACVALGGKWDEKMEDAFIANIGRYRRYKYNSVRDLLRVIRNKLNHYRELPGEIQELLGSIPEGFDQYFGSRFPRLLMEVYSVMYQYCKEEKWFYKYLG